jgi:hypothetical protein
MPSHQRPTVQLYLEIDNTTIEINTRLQVNKTEMLQ